MCLQIFFLFHELLSFWTRMWRLRKHYWQDPIKYSVNQVENGKLINYIWNSYKNGRCKEYAIINNMLWVIISKCLLCWNYKSIFMKNVQKYLILIFQHFNFILYFKLLLVFLNKSYLNEIKHVIICKYSVYH